MWCEPLQKFFAICYRFSTLVLYFKETMAVVLSTELFPIMEHHMKGTKFSWKEFIRTSLGRNPKTPLWCSQELVFAPRMFILNKIVHFIYIVWNFCAIYGALLLLVDCLTRKIFLNIFLCLVFSHNFTLYWIAKLTVFIV